MQVKALLTASLSLNAVACIGALTYGMRRFAAPPATASMERYYLRRASLFEDLRQSSGVKLVFAGDSLTAQCEWAELLSIAGTVNRGIDSDTSSGLLRRIRSITALRPSRLFLLIGVNDLARGASTTSILRNYAEILQTIRSETPRTTVYVQSILPNPAVRQATIIELNLEIRRLASQRGVPYINLYSHMAESDGRIKPEFTNDGAHLMAAGYEEWKSVLAAAGVLEK